MKNYLAVFIFILFGIVSCSNTYKKQEFTPTIEETKTNEPILTIKMPIIETLTATLPQINTNTPNATKTKLPEITTISTFTSQVYLVNTKGLEDLYLISFNGRKKVNIAEGIDGYKITKSISPSGRWIIFGVSERLENRINYSDYIGSINLKRTTKAKLWITDHNNNRKDLGLDYFQQSISWAIDESMFVTNCSDTISICIINMNDFSIVNTGYKGYFPRFSSTDKSILWIEKDDEDNLKVDIVMLSEGSDHPRMLTNYEGSANNLPIWSINGESVLYFDHVDKEDGNHDSILMNFNLATSKKVEINRLYDQVVGIVPYFTFTIPKGFNTISSGVPYGNGYKYTSGLLSPSGMIIHWVEMEYWDFRGITYDGDLILKSHYRPGPVETFDLKSGNYTHGKIPEWVQDYWYWISFPVTIPSPK